MQTRGVNILRNWANFAPQFIYELQDEQTLTPENSLSN